MKRTCNAIRDRRPNAIDSRIKKTARFQLGFKERGGFVRSSGG